MSDKPRPGGSRDDTRNTINLTRDELMDLLDLLFSKYKNQQTSELPLYYGDDDSRPE
jgi:hypothetical protein